MVRHPADLFLEACGATGPLQLNVQDRARPEAGRRVFHFHQPFAVIGRDPRNDLSLNDLQVSRRHTYLQIVMGRVFWVDLGSEYGTLGQAGAAPCGWLDPHKAVTVGPFSIQLLRDNPSGPADLPADDCSPLLAGWIGDATLPSATLEFVNRASKQAPWRMNRVLALVGRSPECKVQLVSSSVSRTHCSLIRTPAGVWVVDFVAREGTLVNGKPVRYARLNNGDVLQVGKFVLRFWQDVPASSSKSGSAVVVASHFSKREASLPACRDKLIAADDSRGSLVPAAPAASLPDLSSLANTLSIQDTMPLLPAGLQKGEVAETLLVPLMNQFRLMQQQMFDQYQQGMLMMVQMFSAVHKDQLSVIRKELDQLQQLTQELQTLQARRAQDTTPARPKAAALALASQASAAQPVKRAREPEREVSNGFVREKKLTSKAGPPEPDVHDWLSRRIEAIQQERQSRWQKLVGYLTGSANGQSVP